MIADIIHDNFPEERREGFRTLVRTMPALVIANFGLLTEDVSCEDAHKMLADLHDRSSALPPLFGQKVDLPDLEDFISEGWNGDECVVVGAFGQGLTGRRTHTYEIR